MNKAFILTAWGIFALILSVPAQAKNTKFSRETSIQDSLSQAVNPILKTAGNISEPKQHSNQIIWNNPNLSPAMDSEINEGTLLRLSWHYATLQGTDLRYGNIKYQIKVNGTPIDFTQKNFFQLDPSIFKPGDMNEVLVTATYPEAISRSTITCLSVPPVLLTWATPTLSPQPNEVISENTPVELTWQKAKIIGDDIAVVQYDIVLNGETIGTVENNSFTLTTDLIPPGGAYKVEVIAHYDELTPIKATTQFRIPIVAELKLFTWDTPNLSIEPKTILENTPIKLSWKKANVIGTQTEPVEYKIKLNDKTVGTVETNTFTLKTELLKAEKKYKVEVIATYLGSDPISTETTFSVGKQLRTPEIYFELCQPFRKQSATVALPAAIGGIPPYQYTIYASGKFSSSEIPNGKIRGAKPGSYTFNLFRGAPLTFWVEIEDFSGNTRISKKITCGR